MPNKFEYTPLPPLSKGDLLEGGKYEIISDTENAGGFGRIYRARVRQTSATNRMKVVAVKEFHVHEIDDATMSRLSSQGFSVSSKEKCVDMLLGQFKIEAQVMYELSRLRDCHIPQIYHRSREDNGRIYYTMSWVDGISLTDIVKQKGAMNERTAIGYIVQIAKVLHKAHTWNLIHSDVSPNNIMLDHGFAVLVDFGNARGYNNLLLQNYNKEEMDYVTDGYGKSLSNMSHFAEIYNEMIHEMIHERIGTPGFMPPEGFAGRQQSDIYSLAATLFFMLTGQNPPLYFLHNSQQKVRKTLAESCVSETTANAIMHAMQSQLNLCTKSARDFLMELPQDIVFDTLLNYNDHDYNRR